MAKIELSMLKEKKNKGKLKIYFLMLHFMPWKMNKADLFSL